MPILGAAFLFLFKMMVVLPAYLTIVLLMFDTVIMGVKYEQEEAENKTLGGSSAEH